MKSTSLVAIALTLVVALSACGQKQEAATPPAPAAEGSAPAPSTSSKALIINGDSMESCKTSIKSIRTTISGAKLKEFDDAISTIEFILKESAYLELGGKNIDEVISSRGGVEDLYVKASNMELSSANLESLENQLNLINRKNEFIKIWNKYAGNPKRDDDDVKVAHALLPEVVELEEKAIVLLKAAGERTDKYDSYVISNFSEAKSVQAKANLDAFKKDNSDLKDVLNKINRLIARIEKQMKS